MFKVVVSEQAIKDINSIKDYITKVLCNPKAASDLIKKIRSAMHNLDYNPERFQEILIDDLSIRRIPINKYNIYYKVETNNRIVTIARILYGGVDINQIAIIN